MNKKIAVSFALGVALAAFPLVSSAQLATPTDSSATSTDFSNFVGLQVPAGLQFDNTAPAGVTGVNSDGLMTFMPESESAPAPASAQYPDGPRLIKLEGSDVTYWV